MAYQILAKSGWSKAKYSPRLSTADSDDYDRRVVGEDGRILLKLTPSGDIFIGDDQIDIDELFVMEDNESKRKAIDDLRNLLKLLIR